MSISEKNEDVIELNPLEEFESIQEQLKLIISRGQLTMSSLHADFYKPIKCDGKTYRTHCIMVDVME